MVCIARGLMGCRNCVAIQFTVLQEKVGKAIVATIQHGARVAGRTARSRRWASVRAGRAGHAWRAVSGYRFSKVASGNSTSTCIPWVDG